jgi:signal transduction histidine kinase
MPGGSLTSARSGPATEQEVTATAEPRGTTLIDRRPKLAWYLAAAIVTVVFCGYSLVGLNEILRTSVDFGRSLYGLLAAGSLLAIQLFYFSRPATRLDSTLSRVMLAAQACLAYFPLPTFGQAWIGLPSFLAGTVLLVLRPRVAWPVFAAIIASVTWAQALLDGVLLEIIYTPIGVSGFAVEVYLLTRLARMVAELHQARTELARCAVAEQRLTFTRDLHDQLGLSLSAIALKGELIHRLLKKSTENARRELTEIITMTQRTLSDVRSVARGYRELSLEKESRTAESLLAASDIAVRVHLDQGTLAVQARSMLAKFLREGVTNVLRYNNVERCEIAVRQHAGRVSLDIINDGVAADDLPQAPEAGMTALFEEVAALGGTASAGGDDGRFRLHLELPLPDESGLAATSDQRDRRQSQDVRLVRGLLTAVFCSLTVAAVVHVLYLTGEFWAIALSIGYLAALLALQLSYFNRPTTRLRSPQTYALLFVEACLIYLPLIPLQHNWVSMPGLLAGNALLVLPPAAGWSVFAMTVGSSVWIQIEFGSSATDIIFNGVAALLSSLVVFGLLWMTRLVTELNGTRRRLAEMAVAEERLRFARDLHDLLGMSLSAITLKSELTSRLLAIDKDKAAEEMAEILGLTRQALADVRSVASGYHELSLESESRTAQSVLAAADVQVRMEMAQHDLPVPVRTVLAVVLREGVTNVLRHSKVEHCEITVRRTADGVCLDIINDGVEKGDVPAELVEEAPGTTVTPHSAAGNGAIGRHQPPGRGSGIGNMSHRVANLGGQLTTGVEPDGRFRLHAVVPF